MGAMKPDQHFSRKTPLNLRSVGLSFYAGRTRFESYVYALTLDATLSIREKTAFQIKIPYMYTSGDGWFLQGLGDISLAITHPLVERENYKISFTWGGKIPTSNGDRRWKNGLPLPMYYQPSLGSWDLVLGASYINSGWLLAVGYQQPFTQNQNQFAHEAWENTGREADVLVYPESRNLRRRADVMLRIEKNIRFSRLSLNAGLLPIYRFKQDRIESSETLARVDVLNSSGLALSLILGATYRFSVNSEMKVLFGDRLLERKFNPDGLSREQVFSASYFYNF
ncbi:MAG: hypothetical protein HC913_09080 [Microscillaceae bacterium]|nr:hypothetical protein [Microscillaceae bacterium]